MVTVSGGSKIYKRGMEKGRGAACAELGGLWQGAPPRIFFRFWISKWRL